MNKLRAIIVDDEKNAADLVETMLQENCPEVEILYKANTVIDALKKINQLNPDLLFLDIEMPYANGFDLLQAVPDRNFEVIFTTAYDQYALKAFKFSAVDYILKPISEKSLVIAVNRVLERQNKNQNENINSLLEYIDDGEPKKIALHSSDGIDFVQIMNIVRFEADSRYTKVYMIDGKTYLVSKNIGEFDELLHNYHFFRIHRSHLINLHYVRSVFKKDGGYIIMNDGQRIEVSRRRKDEFLRKMDEISLS